MVHRGRRPSRLRSNRSVTAFWAWVSRTRIGHRLRQRRSGLSCKQSPPGLFLCPNLRIIDAGSYPFLSRTRLKNAVANGTPGTETITIAKQSLGHGLLGWVSRTRPAFGGPMAGLHCDRLRSPSWERRRSVWVVKQARPSWAFFVSIFS
jgi:hypothetical protein